MKRWIVIGLEGSGKSEICNYIEGEEIESKINGDLKYRKNTIEVPGNYIENTWMNNIVIMLAQNQAKANIFLIDATSLISLYPPKFAKAFTKPSLGVITKSDLLNHDKRIKANKILEELGCSNNIFLSFETKEGIDELSNWLQKTK